MDVDVSPADVLVGLDVDVDVDADVDVDEDSVTEDGELKPVAVSVALVLTVINKQSVLEMLPFHVFVQGEHTRRSRVSSSSCRQNKVFCRSCTASPRSHKIRVTNFSTSNVCYACSGTEQESWISDNSIGSPPATVVFNRGIAVCLPTIDEFEDKRSLQKRRLRNMVLNRAHMPQECRR